VWLLMEVVPANTRVQWTWEPLIVNAPPLTTTDQDNGEKGINMPKEKTSPRPSSDTGSLLFEKAVC